MQSDQLKKKCSHALSNLAHKALWSILWCGAIAPTIIEEFLYWHIGFAPTVLKDFRI